MLQKISPSPFPRNTPTITLNPTMVGYVILCRYLREIPPQISFRNNRSSVWFTPQKGNLRGVKIPSQAPWSPDIKPTQLDDYTITIASEESYPDFGSDGGNDDWLDEDDITVDAPPCAHSSHYTDTPSQHPYQPNIGHIKLGPPRPSDSCPHTCAVFSQNANGLGGRRDDKLEKLISLMIENSISPYCLQEMWQL